MRESLAGRVFLYELWPLTVAELTPHFHGTLPDPPLIARLLSDPSRLREPLDELAEGIVGPQAGAAQAAVGHILKWGGLPSLLLYPIGERLAWLDAYQATYLERDLADLARLRDLDAFSRCHRLAALRQGRSSATPNWPGTPVCRSPPCAAVSAIWRSPTRRSLSPHGRAKPESAWSKLRS